MVIGIVAIALILAEVVERAYVTDLAKENIQLKTVSLLKQVNAQIQTMNQLRNQPRREKILIELMERTPDLLSIGVYQASEDSSQVPTLITQMGEESVVVRKGIPFEVTQAISQGKAVSTPQDPKRNHTIKVALPITVQGEIQGVVYAEFWTGQFDTLTAFFLQWSQAIRIGLGVLLVLSINGFLFVWVLRPLVTIGEGIESLGRQQWTAQVPVKSADELGGIAKSFNRMADQIRTVVEENQTLTQALEQSRDELQDRVNQATAELMKNNEALSQLNEQLSVAQREVVHHQRLAVLGQLVATIAHKIGTPLTAISGHLQLLRETSELPQDVQDRVEILLRQTDRLGKVIQSLLSAARTPTLNMEPVPIQMLIDQIANFFRPICDDQEISIVTACDPSLTTIQADPSQLQEILGNLVDNAIDMMPHGGELSLRVFPSAPSEVKTGGPEVSIEISDTGPGIPPDDQHHIFDPFFTTKERGQGTGLGLAIAKEVVMLHGGTLTVRSEVGKGATFHISLPG